MKKTVGFSFLAALAFAVFGASTYGIFVAQEAPATSGYMVYLTIVGIIAGLGGGVTFLARAIKAASRHE